MRGLEGLEAMASHKHDDTSSESKKAAKVDDSKHTVSAKGDLSKILEEVEEMCKAFHVSPSTVVESKDSGTGDQAQPWRSRRSARPPGQQADHDGIPSSLCFQSFVRPGVKSRVKPEWKEIDKLVTCMRKTLRTAELDARLSLEDETKVRSVFEHHPKAEEKMGPGIDHIKVKKIMDEETRCFWVVRTDGIEIDFSYHKCLKAKAAKECPDLLEHYDTLHRDYRKRDAERAHREANKEAFYLEI